MIQDDKHNLLILKALEFFIENPHEEIYLREFARKLNISPNTAQRFLNFFLKENLITEEKKANLRYFIANLDNIFFKHLKITHSIKKIQDSGLIKKLKNEVISLLIFGSVAKGSDNKGSDLDILIISDNEKKIRKILLEIQSKYNREINYHIFNWIQWKKQKEENKAFYEDTISEGIPLIGNMPI